MFNNTDDIVIFNNYNGDELNIIGQILHLYTFKTPIFYN